ncbi:MAG: hypothetical protein K8S18_18985 [Desulfobacula sp.]|nr:hypothetical protein [Desulfobacula sp.]
MALINFKLYQERKAVLEKIKKQKTRTRVIDQYYNMGSVCNFCGKTPEEVKTLIQGPNIFICDQCVEHCYKILKEINAEIPDTDA